MVVVIMVMMVMFVNMMMFMSLNYELITVHIPRVFPLDPLSDLLHCHVVVLVSVPMSSMVVR